MTTDQDTIDRADEIIRQTAPECATGHRRHLAQALSDAGLLAETRWEVFTDTDGQRSIREKRCTRECEALRDWDALMAERDEVSGRLSRLLWELTGGRMSNDGYDVRTMVTEIDAAYERFELNECDHERNGMLDSLQARLDQAVAERNMAVGKVDEMRQRMTSFADAWSGAQATLDRVEKAVESLIPLSAPQPTSYRTEYREGQRDAYDHAEHIIQTALDGEDS